MTFDRSVTRPVSARCCRRRRIWKICKLPEDEIVVIVKIDSLDYSIKVAKQNVYMYMGNLQIAGGCNCCYCQN